MLRLAIHEPGVGTFLEDNSTRVRTWLDVAGDVCAHGYAGPRGRWLRWPGLVSFHCSDSGTVHAFPEKPLAPSIVNDLWSRTVEPLLLQSLGWETLHASAVLSRVGVMALCGDRQAGKSTLAYALSLRGYSQYADDMLVLDVQGPETRVLDRPFGVRLRREPATFFGFDTDRRHFQDVTAVSAAPDTATTRPLAAIYVLRRIPSGAPAVHRLPPASALDAVVRHAHCFNPDGPGRRRLLRNYLKVTTVPVFELCFTSGLEQLDSVCACIEGAMFPSQTDLIPVRS